VDYRNLFEIYSGAIRILVGSSYDSIRILFGFSLDPILILFRSNSDYVFRFFHSISRLFAGIVVVLAWGVCVFGVFGRVMSFVQTCI
jgi:hypothetical protein